MPGSTDQPSIAPTGRSSVVSTPPGASGPQQPTPTGACEASSSTTPSADDTSPPTTSRNSILSRLKARLLGIANTVASHQQAVVELASDACSVLDVGEGAATAVKTSTPWFFRAFSPATPDYHLAKSLKYLEEIQRLIDQHGVNMVPEKTACKLLNRHDRLFDKVHEILESPDRELKKSRRIKGATKKLLRVVQHKSNQSESERIRQKLEAAETMDRRRRRRRSDVRRTPGNLEPINEARTTTSQLNSQDTLHTESDVSTDDEEGPFRDQDSVNLPDSDAEVQ